MKKTNKPFNYLLLFFVFTIILSVNSYSQWPSIAPVNPPTGGFRIDGTLKVTTAAGDWVPGTGTGGYVLQQTAGVWGPVNPAITIFQRDTFDHTSDKIFTGSAFSDDPNTWKWTTGKPTSKCDISTAMFHISASADSKWIILAGDRLSTTGTSYIDVEFNQGILTRRSDSAKFRYVNANGTPIVGTGGRIPNDFVLSMEYSNGGGNATIHYYVWENSGGTWKYVEKPIPLIAAPLTPTGAVSAYGQTNLDSTEVPFGAFGRTKYAPFAFVEAAVNIDAILGGSCAGTGLNIRTVMVKTKASDSYNAALKDFVEPQPVSFTFGSESMNYGDGTFCKSEGTTSPSKSGTGTFTAANYGTVQAPGLVFSDGTPSTTGQVNLTASGAGSYIIIYTFAAGGGCSGEQKDTITINDVSAGSISGDQTICSGGDPVVFGSVAATGLATPTYQWQSSTGTCGAGTFSDISGATSATYDVPSGLATTTTYRRKATSTVNGEACTAFSNCVTVTVNAVTAGTVAGDQTICSSGDPAAFTVSVAATGSQGPTYQWQKSTTSCGAGFADIPSATSATYNDPGPVTQTTYYRRIATSTVNGVACTATSNCITVTVNDVTAGSIGSDHPVCSGGNPSAFTQVAATGSATPTYQWQKSTTSCGAGFADIPSATGATYDDPGPLTQTTYYRRIATSTLNSVACTATSNCVTVTVNNNPSDLTADVIQPSCGTPSGTITVTSGTTGLTFSLNSTDPADFTNNTGVFSGLAAGNYTVRSKNASGCISNGLLKVINSVAAAPPAGDVVIVSNVSCASSTGTLRVVVAGTLADYNNTDFEITENGSGIWYNPTNHVFTFTAGQGYHFTIRRKSDHSCVITVDCNGEEEDARPSNTTTNTNTESGRIATTNIQMESSTTVKAIPNPFNDRVRFVVTSPEPGYGSLDVMNMLGQKVKTVYQGQFNAGTQSFELVLPENRFSTLLYILRVNGKQVSGKLIQRN